MATVDYGILGLGQPNPAERFYQGQQEAQRNLLAQQQLAHAQQQNELARMQMAEYQRGLEEHNRLRASIKPNFDPLNPEHTAVVMREAPTLGPKFIESMLMTQKTAADIAKTKSETQAGQLKTLGIGLTNALKNPTDEVLNRTFDSLDAQGVNTAPFRSQFAAEPDLARRREFITNYATSHPEGRAALEFVSPKWSERSDNKNKWMEDLNPHSPTFGQQTSRVGLSASPDKLAQLAFDQQKFNWEKANPGYEIKETPQGLVAINKRNPADTRPVMMGGVPVEGAKALTEAQGKATGYALRAQEAQDVLKKIGTEWSPLAVTSKQAAEQLPGVGGMTSIGINYAMGKLSPKSQLAEQAQREFVNAVMRQESGAAISASEFENARKQYFPEPGDLPEKIKQKAKNRETAIRSLEIAAGPGMRQPKVADIDTERANAQAAIQDGASPDAVRARFKQKTGQEL